MGRKKGIKVKVEKKAILRLKFFLFLITLLLVISLVLYTYFYFHFSVMVDGAILKKKVRRIPEILSSPSILFAGERIDPPFLKDMLEKRGYLFSKSLSYENSFYPVLKKNRIYIRSEKIWDRRYPSKVVRVDFEDGKISRIYDLLAKRYVKRYYIIPEEIGFSRKNFKFKYIKYGDVPQDLIYAILSAEDKRFFKHSGIDFWGILRASIKNLIAGRIVQGGSTLTQQIVKNLFLSPEKSFKRKFKEAFIANILEERFSKSELLELYINFVYLGQVNGFEIHGFREASQIFFGKDLKSLSLDKLALLAGMVKSPIKFSPILHRKDALSRRNEVLKLMYKNGFISKVEYLSGIKREIGLNVKKMEYIAPYFADYVSSKIGDDGGMVLTSLNTEIQFALKRGVRDGYKEILEKLSQLGVDGFPQVAAVVLNGKNGNIVAMTGGIDYFSSQYNRAIYIRRQAGSIIKPFVYLSLLENSLSPTLTVDDHPIVFRYGGKRYLPHNFKNIYYGVVDMKRALSKSDNVATVKFASLIGFKKVSDFINELGFKNRAVPYPSVALGTIDVSPIEIGRAYTIFLNGGVELDTTFLWKKRKVLKKVASSENVKRVYNMMEEVVKSGTARGLRPLLKFFPIAGKTGTSKDGWFVGICNNLITVIWVGFDENRELGLSGGRSALYIYREFLKNLMDVYPLKVRDGL